MITVLALVGLSHCKNAKIYHGEYRAGVPFYVTFVSSTEAYVKLESNMTVTEGAVQYARKGRHIRLCLGFGYEGDTVIDMEMLDDKTIKITRTGSLLRLTGKKRMRPSGMNTVSAHKAWSLPICRGCRLRDSTCLQGKVYSGKIRPKLPLYLEFIDASVAMVMVGVHFFCEHGIRIDEAHPPLRIDCMNRNAFRRFSSRARGK